MPWLSLDLDGTLADHPFARSVLPGLRARLEAAGAGPVVRAEYLRRFASDDPASAYDWDSIYALAWREARLDGEPPSLAALARKAAFDPGLVYSDAPPALERFRRGGWRLALGSNGMSAHQRLALERLGLECELALTPDTTGFVKPQAGFLRALPELAGDRAALDGLVHAGDLLAQDVLAANRAGARAAWVWREMPAAWRAVPAAERAVEPGLAAVVATEFALELDRDGRVGALYDLEPRPDLVVADLLELADALGAPA